MALKTYRATTHSRRYMILPSKEEVTKDKPEKALIRSSKKTAGRNSIGRITIRHRGGGHKRKYRIIDFARNKIGIPAKVEAIEYDPNRTCYIALLSYADGEKRYILAPAGLVPGMKLVSGPESEPVLGNALPLANIPLGLFVHNIEIEPGKGGKMVRTAGGSAQLMSREGEHAQIRLPSGEIRLVNVRCMATIGQVGHIEHSGVSEGKAGRKRWRGIRPTVRGVAMNPVDHPMGGGEGRTSGGGHPVSPWGKLSKAGKTRSRRKTSSRFIVKRRK
ncbi:MAG: 50S ribosomal protein L2 [Verrucomicrobia bacterium]|nr:50S ribosomal protein L2 [Verrucomicrobiota bacterium]